MVSKKKKNMEAISIVNLIFGVHMNIKFVIKVKILMLIKWSYRSPQLNP